MEAEYLGGGALAASGSGRLATGDPFTVVTTSRADFTTMVQGRAGFAFDRAFLYTTGGLAIVELCAPGFAVGGSVE